MFPWPKMRFDGFNLRRIQSLQEWCYKAFVHLWIQWTVTASYVTTNVLGHWIVSGVVLYMYRLADLCLSSFQNLPSEEAYRLDVVPNLTPTKGLTARCRSSPGSLNNTAGFRNSTYCLCILSLTQYSIIISLEFRVMALKLNVGVEFIRPMRFWSSGGRGIL